MQAVATEARSLGPEASAAEVNQLLRAVLSILDAVSDEWDVCVQWRLEEIARFSELLRRGGALAGAELHCDFGPLTEIGPADFRVSTLDDRLDALRARLGALLAWLEERPAPENAVLWHEIWDCLLSRLRAQTERWGMTAY